MLHLIYDIGCKVTHKSRYDKIIGREKEQDEGMRQGFAQKEVRFACRACVGPFGGCGVLMPVFSFCNFSHFITQYD